MLMLTLSVGNAYSIPLPDLNRQRQEEERMKSKADLVVAADRYYRTHYLEEGQTRLPPIETTYRLWSHYRVLSVERNTLNRALPSPLIFDEYVSESPLKCISIRPTMSALAGELPCKEWNWVFPRIRPGELQSTIVKPAIASQTADERWNLWIQTSNEDSIVVNQKSISLKFTKLAAKHTTNVRTGVNENRRNTTQDQPACLPVVFCAIAPCPEQKSALKCLFDNMMVSKPPKQAISPEQLLLGGYITAVETIPGVADARSSLVVLGYRVYTSGGGILGNGGTDRAVKSSVAAVPMRLNTHYIGRDTHEKFAPGQYVYLSCTIHELDSMSCALDSLDGNAMITELKSVSESWMPGHLEPAKKNGLALD